MSTHPCRTADAPLLICVYGDSLSLPRADQGLHWFGTYPELLRGALDSPASGRRLAIFNRSRGGASIDALYELFIQDSAYIGTHATQITIIQCGIVDCSPRPVSPATRAVIGRLPAPLRWICTRLLHYLRPYLLRAGSVWRSTPRDAFEALLRRWLRTAADRADCVYVVNIAPTTDRIEAHSPGLRASIADYNRAIAEAVRGAARENIVLIDVHAAILAEPDGINRMIVASDGHHITPDGHRLFAALLAEAVRSRTRPGGV